MRARLARTIRGWSIALLAGVLTATVHAAAGGAFPAAPVLLLAVLLAGLVSTVVIGRSPSLPRLLAAVGCGQLTFHTVFSTLGDSGGVALVPVTPAGHAGHAAHAAMLAEAAAHPAAVHSGVGMLLAHVAAGVVSVLLLAHSERALAAVRRAAVFTLRRLTLILAPLPLPRLRSAAIDAAVALPRGRQLFGTLRDRGPPALLRAA